MLRTSLFLLALFIAACGNLVLNQNAQTKSEGSGNSNTQQQKVTPPPASNNDNQEPANTNTSTDAKKEEEPKEGFDKDGFDKEGFDKDGFDRDGFDKKGMDRYGKKRPDGNKPEEKKPEETKAEETDTPARGLCKGMSLTTESADIGKIKVKAVLDGKNIAFECSVPEGIYSTTSDGRVSLSLMKTTPTGPATQYNISCRDEAKAYVAQLWLSKPEAGQVIEPTFPYTSSQSIGVDIHSMANANVEVMKQDTMNMAGNLVSLKAGIVKLADVDNLKHIVACVKGEFNNTGGKKAGTLEFEVSLKMKP